jgi:hypothetical protein
MASCAAVRNRRATGVAVRKRFGEVVLEEASRREVMNLTWSRHVNQVWTQTDFTEGQPPVSASCTPIRDQWWPAPPLDTHLPRGTR